MQAPYKPNPKQIRTEDLDPVFDFLQSLNFRGDGINIVVDHDPTGVLVKFIGEITPQTESSGGGDTNVYPCIVTSITSTAVYGVKMENPTETPFLIAPLSYQDTNLSVGNVIMATEYTAITL